MNNQSSPAQLLFPTVPANYCPEGKWSDVLNSFITLYLNNGTVNIPFLNEVTPQQITTLQQNVLSIQNQLDAVSYKTGSITSITTGIGTYVVSFPTAMPTSAYLVTMNFNATATPTALPAWSISAGTKATTGFTFFANCPSGSNVTSIVWSVYDLSVL
jgi:hypothetical protein